jgi:hypothetical protein
MDAPGYQTALRNVVTKYAKWDGILTTDNTDNTDENTHKERRPRMGTDLQEES